jgi:FMN-dependent NADH-azoreductase
MGDQKPTILHINTSITPDSITARVAKAMVDHLKTHYHRAVQAEGGAPAAQNPDDLLTLDECDCWGPELPKFDREVMQRVWRARHNSQDEADLAAFRPIQALASQLLRADFLIVTVPVWNFNIPYVLKQYIDCIVQPGLTFKDADATGPSGPYFRGRPVIIISSSGGKAPPPNEEFVFSFLHKIFAMCGFDEPYHVAISGCATQDKDVVFNKAVKEITDIADKVVQSHKLHLEANA